MSAYICSLTGGRSADITSLFLDRTPARGYLYELLLPTLNIFNELHSPGLLFDPVRLKKLDVSDECGPYGLLMLCTVPSLNLVSAVTYSSKDFESKGYTSPVFIALVSSVIFVGNKELICHYHSLTIFLILTAVFCYPYRTSFHWYWRNSQRPPSSLGPIIKI